MKLLFPLLLLLLLLLLLYPCRSRHWMLRGTDHRLRRRRCRRWRGQPWWSHPQNNWYLHLLRPFYTALLRLSMEKSNTWSLQMSSHLPLVQSLLMLSWPSHSHSARGHSSSDPEHPQTDKGYRKTFIEFNREIIVCYNCAILLDTVDVLRPLVLGAHNTNRLQFWKHKYVDDAMTLLPWWWPRPWGQTWGRGWWCPPPRTRRGSPRCSGPPGSGRRACSHCLRRSVRRTHNRPECSDSLSFKKGLFWPKILLQGDTFETSRNQRSLEIKWVSTLHSFWQSRDLNENDWCVTLISQENNKKFTIKIRFYTSIRT